MSARRHNNMITKNNKRREMRLRTIFLGAALQTALLLTACRHCC